MVIREGHPSRKRRITTGRVRSQRNGSDNNRQAQLGRVTSQPLKGNPSGISQILRDSERF
eukprot:8214570-Pyramimonas_sp.AAC.1